MQSMVEGVAVISTPGIGPQPSSRASSGTLLASATPFPTPAARSPSPSG